MIIMDQTASSVFFFLVEIIRPIDDITAHPMRTSHESLYDPVESNMDPMKGLDRAAPRVVAMVNLLRIVEKFRFPKTIETYIFTAML